MILNKYGKSQKIFKIFLTAFTFLIVFSSFNFITFTVNKVSASVAELSIESIYVGDTVWAGNTFRVEVTVRNNTPSAYEGVFVAAEASNSLLTIESFKESDRQRIEADSQTVFSFIFKTSESAKSGDQAQIKLSVIRLIGEEKRVYSSSTRTVTVYENPNAGQDSHGFSIVAETYPKTISIGSNLKIAIRFVNLGGFSKGVVTELDYPSELEPLILPAKAIGDMLVGQTAYIEFDFKIPLDAKLGLNTFKLRIYNSDKSVTLDYPIGIYIEKSSSAASANAPNINILSVDLPENVKRGEKFQMKTILENTGADAENIIVKAIFPTGIANNSSNIIQIASLKRDEQSDEIVFDAVVTDDASDYYNLIEIQVEYLTEKNSSNTSDTPNTSNTSGKIVKTQYAGLNVLEGGANSKDFTITADVPEKVKPGEDFTLSFTVKNNGVDEKNFFMSVTVPDGMVNKSITTFPVSELKSGDSVTKEITFSATDEAEGKYCLFGISVYGKQADGKETVYANQYAGIGVGNIEMPKIVIESISIPSIVNMGEVFNVGVTVSNTGTTDAENIILNIILPGKGILNQTANTVKIESLKIGEKQTEDFTFIVTQDADYGYNAFTAEVSYGIKSETNGEKVNQYFGVIVNSSDLRIESVKVPTSVRVNNDFTVEVTVKNTGADARDVLLTLTPQTGLINKTANTVKIDNLKSDETAVKTFTFMALESAPNGYTAIDIALTKGEETIKQYSGTNVINPEKEDEKDGEKKDMPVIIISRFSYGEEDMTAVYGGQTFNFTLELQNMHKEISVKDLKITISSLATTAQTGGVFNPKSGSNTFFVEQLYPGETIEKSLELIVKSDAVPDSYGITVDFSYKNENGDSTTASEIINIPVQQELRFSVGEIAPIVEEIQVGDDVYIKIQVGNLGRSQIYNTFVKIQGEGFISPEGTTWYAGHLEAGKSQEREFYLTPIMPGMLTSKFVFEYEDAEGKQYTEEQDFSFMVMGGDTGDMGMIPPGMIMDENGNMIEIGPDGMPVMNPGSEEELEENTGFWLFTNMNIWKWFIIIGSGIVILSAVTFVIIIIVKKRKMKNIDVDDDDDI